MYSTISRIQLSLKYYILSYVYAKYYYIILFLALEWTNIFASGNLCKRLYNLIVITVQRAFNAAHVRLNFSITRLQLAKPSTRAKDIYP